MMRNPLALVLIVVALALSWAAKIKIDVSSRVFVDEDMRYCVVLFASFHLSDY
jgi:hypothetical protein